MAINRKLIHFKTWDTFISQDGVNGNYSNPSSGNESDGTAVYGQLLGTSIVFIKDVQKIWTHGKLYNCKDPDQILSESSENAVQNKIVASEFKRVWESIEEESKKKEVIIIDISNEWLDGEVHDIGLSFEQYINSKVIFRIPVGSNGESVTYEKVSLFANGTNSDDTFYEVYIGRTNLIDIPFVFTVSPIYSNDNVNVGIQYDIDNNFGPILPYVGNGNSAQFLAGDGTWKTIETNPFEVPANGVLPETGKAGKIYIIPSSVTGEDNIMQEYIWVDNKWEKLGEFKADVDLSGYYTKTETDTLVNTTKSSIDESIRTLNTNITSQLDTKLDVSVANETLATKDEVIAETDRALQAEGELDTRIEAHEAITQQAATDASEANAYAQTAYTKSTEAVNTANVAKNAIATLEGLVNADEAQQTLAETVIKIEQNTNDIEVLKEKFVVLSETEYTAIELKDPDKIYFVYEE